MNLSQAIDGYNIYANARRLSPNTMRNYSHTFKKFGEFLGDPVFHTINHNQVSKFLGSLPVSKRTALDYHTALSALFTWAEREALIHHNPMIHVPRPKPEHRKIEPYTTKDLNAMLGAINTGQFHKARNTAIIYVLLDTGVRASELAGLRVVDFDRENLHISVYGKGDKERSIPVSPKTAQKIWGYLVSRGTVSPGDPLFVTTQGKPLTRDRLLKTIKIIAKRAGVAGAFVHRFRHTFAIEFLRNGANVYALQRILGHSDLKTCLRYLRIVQADIDKQHTNHSPVTNLL